MIGLGVSDMRTKYCLIGGLPVLALALSVPLALAQEEDREVRARATWRPQAPELRELPPGVERDRERFRVERPEVNLPGIEPSDDPALPEPGGDPEPREASVRDAREAAPPAAGSDPDAEIRPADPAVEDPPPALRESRVESPEPPAAVDATDVRRTLPISRRETVSPPEYPPDALRRGVEGYVTLEFTVSASGRVRDVAITEAQPEGVFERAVREAVRGWRFEPATEGGEPVPQRVRHRFDFNLDG